MEIFDIMGRNVKIGKSSLTVKDENGKTCGVITGIKTWGRLCPREQFDAAKLIRRTGIRENNLLSNLVFDGRQIYFLDDAKKREFYERYAKGRLPDDERRYLKYTETVEKVRQSIPVIECRII